MVISGESIDDILIKIYKKIIRGRSNFVKSTKGINKEVIGVMLHLKDPRARLSRSETKGKIFSCLGELVWYLSGSDNVSFIQYYIPGYEKYAEPDGTVHGAYGPRIFGQECNQFEVVREKLTSHDGTRKAVIQIFDAKDILRSYNDVPCTCTLQFFIRNGKLDLVVYMRSSDAFKGLPHDIFCFTMLQEIMARSVGCDIGSYKHFSGSLHIYDYDLESVQQYINEGYQSKWAMPEMPYYNVSKNIELLVEYEKNVRNNVSLRIPSELDAYWRDIFSVLRFYSNSKRKRKYPHVSSKIIDGLNFKFYEMYLEARRRKDLVNLANSTVDLFGG